MGSMGISHSGSNLCQSLIRQVVGFGFFFLYVKALLKALVCMILWFNNNVMDVVSVVMSYLVIFSDAKNEILPGDDKDLLN